jgi:hypothetical protein
MNTSGEGAGKTISILISDKAGAAQLTHMLDAQKIAFSAVLSDGRTWPEKVSRSLGSGLSNLVLVPTENFGLDAVDVAAAIEKTRAHLLVWSAAPSSAFSRQWLLEKLLEQRGAYLCLNPSVIAALIRLLPYKRDLLENGVAIRGPKSSLYDRLSFALAHFGIGVGKKGKGAVSLNVHSKHGISLAEGDPGAALGSPFAVAAAIAQMAEMTPPTTLSPPEVVSDHPDLALILEPPKRLLSEVVSKKILSAFGMRLPHEQLCQSASEAARFASTVAGPVVLKLVKPQLQGKAEKGAVITHLEGRAAVRRAAQILEGLAVTLGPPPPLGLLVAEQIAADAAVWVEMVDHPDFGRLVRGGAGHLPVVRPDFVLKAPATVEAATRSLKRSNIPMLKNAAAALGRGIAHFSEIVYRLGDRIDRAEIHPLVTEAAAPEPVALDALFAIAG